jgi:hypothetical protein
MIHDELRDYIDKFDAAGMLDFPAIKALRAVVELHYPVIHALPDETCWACQDLYPCPTIQAIERELG